MDSRAERNPDDRDDDRGEDRPNRRVTPEENKRIAAARIERIQRYLADRYDRRDIAVRTVTPAGQALDWVPVESQLSQERLADPPDEDRPWGQAEGDRPTEPMRFELQQDGVDIGPAGTVPLVRKPIDRITVAVELNDWLAKGARALRQPMPDDPRQFASPEDAGVHKYAATAQTVTCYGTDGNINAWDPYVNRSDEFSLGQLSLSRGVGSAKQTLEVGHQEYRDLYGDWVPHLFVFYTTNGYTEQGDNKGGYNQDVDGWVQYSNTIYPEALSSPLSQFGGAQYIMALKVQLWQSNWWVRVNGTWIGYYPARLYNASGLANEAESVKWFGEIVDSAGDPATTRTDMGNGHWPYEGWQHCAFMNNLRYQSSTGGGMSRYKGTGWATHPSCYDVETHFDNTDNWGSYFWWGGSGRNSQCP